jgi:hypothetical protein
MGVIFIGMKKKIAPLALVLALSLLSCNLDTNYFGEYIGVNLISDYDFDNPAWVAANAAPTVPELVTFTDVSGVEGNGPQGGPAYDLGIINLYDPGHGGKFTGAAPAAGFSTTGSGLIATINLGTFVDPVTYRPINGDSIRITTDLGNNNVIFNFLPYFEGEGNYMLHFDFRTWNEMIVQTWDDVKGLSNNIRTDHPSIKEDRMASVFPFPSPGIVNVVPLTYRAPLPTSFRLIFGQDGGSGFDQSTVIDNLKLIKIDEDLGITLTLPSIGSTSLQLLPGFYDFSVYVKDHPDASDDSMNIFHASGITLQTQANTKSGSQSFGQFKSRPTGGWAGWTKLTWSQAIDFVSEDTLDNALTISLTTTNILRDESFRDAGSVLIADPTLEFRER